MGFASKLDNLLVVIARLAFILLGSALILYGVVLLGYQVVYWLKWQQWQGCTMLDLMRPAYSVDGPITWMPTSPTASGWLNNPRGWYGLHTILTWLLGHIPFGIACIAMGAVIFLNGSNIKTVYEDIPAPK